MIHDLNYWREFLEKKQAIKPIQKTAELNKDTRSWARHTGVIDIVTKDEVPGEDDNKGRIIDIRA